MHGVELEAEEAAANGVPRQSDRPPVGEPLVVSRRNPAARPAVTAEPVPTAAEPVSPPDPGGDLDGRVAVVTGAAAPLGHALATEMVARGARVLLVDDDLESLARTSSGLGGGDRAVAVRCDVASPPEVAAACDFVARATEVDLVVCVIDVAGSDAPAEPGVVAGADADPEHSGAAGLDRRYRRLVGGPVDLVAGLAPTLVDGARVVLVERLDPDRGALAEVAPVVVREHLPKNLTSRVTTASCGAGIGPDTFASVLVDLLSADDVPVERIVLSEPSRDASAPVPDLHDRPDDRASDGIDGEADEPVIRLDRLGDARR